MAQLYPRNLPDTAEMSERVVFDVMAGLPDSWTVLWDVPIGLFGRPKANLRQIDLLLVHEQLGVIVVEVKGGSIKVEGGEWSTQPRGSSTWHPLKRSPFSQAADQRFALQRYFSDRLRLSPDSFSHAVALPGCTVTDDLGPDAPREIVIDAADLSNPTAALHRVRGHWGTCPRLTASEIEAMVQALKPNFEMTVVSSVAAASTGEAIERETRRQVDMVESQVAAYKSLLATDRVVVLGGAGTGKTVLAAERAKLLAQTGSKTLLLCHRAAVRSFLFTLLGVRSSLRNYDPASEDALQVASWSGVSAAAAAAIGAGSNSPLSENLVASFLELRDSLPRPYDALVIDEGQEFTPRQIEALSWLLDDPDASPFYVFADPFQHSGLFSTPQDERRDGGVRFKWESPLEAETVLLTTNCRNSQQVASVASRFYPGDSPTPIVDGPEPTYHQTPPANLLATVFNLAGSLVKREGFRPNQLLVVAVGFEPAEAERASRRTGTATVRIDEVYRFPLTPKDLRVAWGTPNEVQGLEADVVLVAYCHEGRSLGAVRELYISASRARSVLHIVSEISQREVLELEPVLAAELAEREAAREAARALREAEKAERRAEQAGSGRVPD